MVEHLTKGLVLEKKVGTIIVILTASEGETPNELYNRLNTICDEIEKLEDMQGRVLWVEEVRPRIEESIEAVKQHFKLENENLTETGVTSDYHMVILSLLWNFDQCLGATAIAEQWGGINTGRVSRVFTASRKSLEIYRGHFEKCRKGGYRFSRAGLEYALKVGIREILG